MTRPTRREVLAAMIAAPGLIALAAPALAESTSEVKPGESIWIPTAPGNRYTSVKFTNLGPGAAEIEVAGRNFNKVFVIKEGAVLKVTEIFGSDKTEVRNNATGATVRIDLRWL